MPVILQNKNEDFWLESENKDFDKLFKLLKPYPEDSMLMNVVSKRVNNPRNDDPDLIKELEGYQTKIQS